MPERNRTFVELSVVGKDRKGVVASFTSLLFKNGGNIESVSQNVVRGLFGMQLEASFSQNVGQDYLTREFRRLGRELSMDVGIHYQETGRKPNLAILVTKEPQCPERIIDAVKNERLRANIAVVIGSESTLAGFAKQEKLPFYSVNDLDTDKRESRMLSILQNHNVDIIALARYMRILSPNFVWRYPNKIINVHPSILPAFPGAFAYEQAFERGARIIGCTAHFVTMDLDEGPIIWQESFRVKSNEDLKSIRARGRELEAKALVKALQLFTRGRLEVRWGKVYIKR
ncbi:MAG: formyltetrahydrofolate deformylase [Nitrososphaerota archaeon]|nr:formyltetrahydrofolate deformylase [Nitrososphaerota archaeon]